MFENFEELSDFHEKEMPKVIKDETFDLSETKTLKELGVKTVRLLQKMESQRYSLPWKLSDWKYMMNKVLQTWIDTGYINYNQFGQSI